MLTDTEIERFLKIRSTKLLSLFPIDQIEENIILYAELYTDIENKYLKDIFLFLHAALNNLLEFMYHKYKPGDVGHYNAAQSRQLIEIIDFIRFLNAELKHSSLNFQMDSFYVELLEICKTFLQKSHGSGIPTNLPSNQLVDYRAIFKLVEVVNININRPQASEKFELKVIGEGSYAKVFKFKDTFYTIWFVLKKAKKDLTNQELIRFKNEYLETRKLNSPYVIRVYNYNDEKNEYVMEYANGKTLADYIAVNNTKLLMKERINLISQLFKAFSYIHSKALLHRDVSYQNILIQEYDDVTLLKVADFGLVKAADSILTNLDSSVKGSLNDPDLIRVGFANYEVRHEVYALAQVVNFILCGKKHANGIFDKCQLAYDFILKGLNPDINKRHPSVNAMIIDFDTVRKELLRCQ